MKECKTLSGIWNPKEVADTENHITYIKSMFKIDEKAGIYAPA